MLKGLIFYLYLSDSKYLCRKHVSLRCLSERKILCNVEGESS